jgi:hypothetical protein
LTRAATLTPSSFDQTKRTVGLIWSTGAAVQRYDFEGPFTERLDMSPDALDLSQLPRISRCSILRSTARAALPPCAFPRGPMSSPSCATWPTALCRA